MKKMTQLIFVMGLTWITTSMNACSAPMHSNFSSSSSSSVEDQLFTKVKTILDSKCISCHTEGGRAISFNLNSSSDFIRTGLVVPGVPNQSKLIFRLKNFVAQGALNNNMPPTGPALENSDYQVLYSWILEMSSQRSPYTCNSNAMDYTRITATNSKRLSIRQYRNTLIDLLAPAVSRGTATTLVNNAMNGVYFPQDVGVHFKRESNIFGGDHAQGFFDVADRLSTAVASNAGYTQSLATHFINLSPGACTNTIISSLSTTCRSRLVNNLGSRTLRRPLRTPEQNVRLQTGVVVDESEPLLSEFGTSGSAQDGLSRLLFRLLVSPHFLTQTEDQNLVGQKYQNSNVYWLNSFAIINRLSYRFWNTMPDEAMWNFAMSEDLSSETGYLRVLDYALSQTSKLDDSLREYMNDWLHLDRTPQFAPNTRFPLVSNVSFNAQLRQDMISEVEELGSYTARSRGSFANLFSTNISFARSSGLMNLYGQTTPAPAAITDANAVRFPADQRSGLLTRGALLVSGSEFANPILRGIHVRKEVLCMNLAQPPSNALEIFNNTPAPHVSTTRDKVQIKTSGASCVNCHNLINPLGFALSNYNSFGMYTTQEPIFSQTSNTIQTTVPIDSQVNLSAILNGVGAVNGAMAYGQAIAQQQAAKVCFAEKMMRYSFVRDVSSTRDACRLERIYNNLHESGYVLDTLRSSALDYEFRLRRLDP